DFHLELRFSGKAGNSSRLRIKDLKHADQLGDDKQLIEALVEIEQLHLSAHPLHLRIAGNQLAKSAAVHIAHFRQVDEQLAASTRNAGFDLVFKFRMPSQRKSAVEIKHGYIV